MKPKVLEAKWIKKFAWLPTKMGNGYLQYHSGEKIWLKTYYSFEYYIEHLDRCHWTSIGGPSYKR